MTLGFLELGVAAMLMWASVKCVKFWPLLAGREESGTHCTGSLIALLAGVLAYGLGNFFTKLLTGVGIGVAAGAAAKAGGGGGGGAGGGSTPKETPPAEPAPSEPTPTPELPPVEASLQMAAGTGTGATTSTTGNQNGQSTTFTVDSTPSSATRNQALQFAQL